MLRRARPGRGRLAVPRALLTLVALASLAGAPPPAALASPAPAPAVAPAPQATPALPDLTFTRSLFTTGDTMLAVGDLTGDGDLDIVAEVEGRPALIPGDGRGGLDPARPFGSGGRTGPLYADAALGDLDRDGDLDVVLARWGISLFNAPPVPAAVYHNDGAGGLTLAGTVGPPIDFATYEVALGDADGDGFLDLFYSHSGLWLNDGQGLFPALTSPVPFPRAMGDVNGDGNLDLLALNLYFGDGAGGFTTTSQDPSPTGVALGDMDGDGDLDIVDDINSQALYRNNGAGVFAPPEPFGQNDTSGATALGDMDGDGDLDVVYGMRREANSIYFNDGSGAMSGPLRFGQSDSVTDLVLADMDHDGALDVLTLAFDADGYLYRNSGGAFGRAQPLGVRDDFDPVAAGDLNGDGATDLVSANIAPLPTYFLSDGAGGYLAPRQLPAAGLVPEPDLFVGRTRALTVADVNGDGRQDIVVTRYEFASSVYLGDGAGNFPTVLNFGGPDDPILDVVAADVDQDGDLDLVTAHGTCESSQTTPNKVFLNDGQGGFAASLTFGEARRASAVAVADMNGDGRPDLIAAGGYCLLDDQSYVYMADGAGGFGPGVPFGPRAGWETIVPSDVDGDGDLDLAAGGSQFGGNQNSGGRLYVNSGGTFAEERIFAAQSMVERVDAADFDGDGDPDLLYSGFGEQGLLFNDGGGGFSADEGQSLFELSVNRVVADFDGDGDPDVFNGHDDGTSRLYRNGGGSFTPDAAAIGRSLSLGSASLGDVDGDGDLDILAYDSIRSVNQLLLNDGAGTMTPGETFDSEGDVLGDRDGDGTIDGFGVEAASSTFGDVDGDGDLDQLVGSSFGPPSLRRNDGTGAFGQPELQRGLPPTSVLALGDVDGDGDLDMVAGRSSGSAAIGLNDGSGRFALGLPIAGPFGAEDLDLGDVDGDGDLDFVSGGENQPVAAFLNDGAGAFVARPPFGLGGPTNGVALADLDGDGDLDVLTGGYVRYLNDGAGNFGAGRAFGPGASASARAIGDLNGDGLVDIVAPRGFEQSYIYFNRGASAARLPGSPPAVSLVRPGLTPDAPSFSSDEILATPVITLPFRLSDPNGAPIARLVGSFSLDGGGSWRPAVPVSGTLTTDLPTRGGPGCDDRGCPYTFQWDTFASGVFGATDRAVFRLTAVPGVGLTGDDQSRPWPAALTNPFRLRGTQVRVLQGAQPVPGATVFRLRSGQSLGGTPIGGIRPGLTDVNGFLRGRGELSLGDQLFAMAPITSTGVFTVYATSGAPTAQGVDSQPVSQPGVQTLQVSPGNPLVLFDLLVALEWDASRGPGYLDELSFNLKQASRYLYDFTDGRMALGNVTVSQRADGWGDADVVILANNRVRPSAVQGGVVLTRTVDPQRPAIVYEPGQVRMGATWNRFGTPGQTIGDDWALILAHELSHYLLYLDDAYLGLDEQGLLVPVDGCKGTAMGDLYNDPTASEFIFDQAYWDARCGTSLGARSLGRTEWATITLWYPWLQAPTLANPGPATMPFELTTVQVDPVTQSLTLDDPSFYLDYAGGAISSTEARAFLLRDEQYAFDLGSPFGGQNRLLAYGARPGDRICVFDRPRGQFGCEVVAPGDDRITLGRDTAWAPIITLTPVTSTTLALHVEGVPPGLDLRARLFPEFGEAPPAVALAVAGGVYTATFPLDDQTLMGNLQLWVDEPAAEESPRRESVVSFAVAGSPGYKRTGGGYKRTGGGYKRTGGGYKRTGGGYKRSGGAPVVSTDGQMIFFTPNPASFGDGELYTIQSMAGLPPLPPGKIVVGQGHSLVATPGSSLIGGSVTFQYLPNDALVAGVREEELSIYYFDGARWEALPTTRSPYFNLSSAPSRGQGIYVLMAGQSTPTIAAVTPTEATVGQPIALSIAGSGFLSPASVILRGPSGVYTATVSATTPTTITATIAAGLPAAAYQLVVVNGDGSEAAPVAFAVYAPSSGRFADTFESGSGRWALTGEWGLVPLPEGGTALTDSPGTNYQSAPPNGRRVTTATSTPFSLAGLGNPQLRFRHSYILAAVGANRDEGRVEISTDGGATWQALATFRGGGIYGPAVAALGDEWAGATWREARISLAGYSGTVRLRFTIDVDGAAADRGWVIDDVFVGEAAEPAGERIYLPSVAR